MHLFKWNTNKSLSSSQRPNHFNTQSLKAVLLVAVLISSNLIVLAEAFTPFGTFSSRKSSLSFLNTNQQQQQQQLTSSTTSTSSSSIITAAASTSNMSSVDNEKEITLSKSNWKTYPIDFNNNQNEDTKSPFEQNDQQSKLNWSQDQYNQSLNRYNEFISSQDSYIAPLIQSSLQILLDAYRLYGPKNVIGSFNGGKDAVVIMELMKAAHAKYYHDIIMDGSADSADGDTNAEPNAEDVTMIRPRVIYFNHKLEFEQVYNFVKNTVHKYDLQMIAFEQHISFVKGLDILVQTNKNIPQSFVLGTRNTDPNAGNQGSFAPSSTWMPPFMRVNPILDWTYGHTWHFLRLFKIPYCTLYDEGYTSLGNVEDTLPCPALLKVNIDNNQYDSDQLSSSSSSSSKYWPAYMLKDWDQERAGRLKKEKKGQNKGNDKKESGGSKSSSSSSKNAHEANVSTSNDKKIDTSTITSTDSASPATEKSNSAKSTTTSLTNIKTTTNINTDNDVISLASIASSNATTSSQRSVGLLIIGDEILKGLTPDTNTHAAATALMNSNVPLAKVSVVSDDLDEIVKEIEYMTSFVDVIITSGGVGPTHDDVTIKSVGKALNSDMILNKQMAELLKSKMKTTDDNDDDQELTEAQIKMATLPECSKLRYLSNDKNDWPVLQCKHIFILPGVPQFFEKKVELVASYLSTELERSVAFKVVLSIDENSIVPILNNVVNNHPNVSFGSYPFVNHPEFKTVVTLEGRRVEGGSIQNSSRYLSVDYGDSFDDDDNDFDPKEFQQKEIDLNVKVALADLVNGMPEGSVLRVDNNTDLTFN